MSLVVDASVAIAWALPDEQSNYADRAMRRGAAEGLLVPPLWFLEVANILRMCEKKGRLTPPEADSCFRALVQLVTEVRTADAATLAGASLELARTHGLTTYDAAYLHLAIERGAEVATLDRELARAATQCLCYWDDVPQQPPDA